MGIAWIILVTYVGSKGLEKITKVTSVGGTAVALLNIVLLVGAIVVLIANFFTIIQPATVGDLSSSVWMIAGPVFFTIVALIMYRSYEKKVREPKKEKAA